ncbi:hypothetical protein Ciccas_012339, partial [Cichlidogyrus casuarinus]
MDALREIRINLRPCWRMNRSPFLDQACTEVFPYKSLVTINAHEQEPIMPLSEDQQYFIIKCPEPHIWMVITSFLHSKQYSCQMRDSAHTHSTDLAPAICFLPDFPDPARDQQLKYLQDQLDSAGDLLQSTCA